MNIPYLSQWGPDAGKTIDDCGPACMAMVCNYYGDNLTVNHVFEATGAVENNLISFVQLFKALGSLGYDYSYSYGATPEKIKSLIDSGIPPIVLIHYGYLSNREDSYSGPHFIVISDYDENGYYTEDPDYYGNRIGEGHRKYYARSELEAAWGNCAQDGNPNNALIVIHRKSSQVINSPQTMSDQDKKDIESMNKLRAYNGVWYEAQNIISDFEKAKADRELENKNATKSYLALEALYKDDEKTIAKPQSTKGSEVALTPTVCQPKTYTNSFAGMLVDLADIIERSFKK